MKSSYLIPVCEHKTHGLASNAFASFLRQESHKQNDYINSGNCKQNKPENTGLAVRYENPPRSKKQQQSQGI